MKVADQKWNIAAALAQRREPDRDHLETKIEIFTETLFFDRFVQVLIGRGQDAHVGVQNFAAADPAIFMILQHAQEFGLQFDGDVADFVQKKRAALGQLKLAEAAVEGAGERALFVAEQFAFEQIARDGGAVDRDEGLVPARRIVMDRLCHQFLAGAALAEYQDRRLSVDYLADDFVNALHARAGADDIDAGLETFLDFLFELAKVAAKFVAIQGAFDQQQYFIEVERLGNIIEGAVLHCADGIAHGVLRGHDNHRGINAVVFKFLEQLQAVDIRQLDVHQRDIEMTFAE